MPQSRSRLTVVYNPTKVEDLGADQAVVSDACRRHGWDEPTWIATTEEETGERQARDAVRDGAQCVASLGGDGTVRAVATALVGTDVALGLLPGGTGNLLARNLELPVDTLEEAVEAMLSGSEVRIDAGHVVADDDDEQVFVVMTGLGLDGDIMAGASESVKGVLGWPAYVLSAAANAFNRGFTVTVRSAGGDGVTGASGTDVRRHARTVVVGNCGTLQGGVELMPDAVVDDGILDAVVIAPRGFFGWASVISDVLTRHRAGHHRLDRIRAKELTIEAARPVETEIDGDPIGERRRLTIRVDREALVVRGG